jgi:hypothetical protein
VCVCVCVWGGVSRHLSRNAILLEDSMMFSSITEGSGSAPLNKYG